MSMNPRGSNAHMKRGAARRLSTFVPHTITITVMAAPDAFAEFAPTGEFRRPEFQEWFLCERRGRAAQNVDRWQNAVILRRKENMDASQNSDVVYQRNQDSEQREQRVAD